MRRIKNSTLIIVIISIVVLILFSFPKSYKIETTLQGMENRIGDPEYSDVVSISIKGVYYKYLFKDDSFDGSISISKYNFTKEIPLLPLRFIEGRGDLHYFNTNQQKSLGTLYCTPQFDKILILVGEPIGETAQSWIGDNGLIITAPAKERLQAVDITRYFINKYEWVDFDFE